ncbi:MAG: hypothetical protein IKP10_01770 [Clostridia bacterium]|nr:hypothetical protein [Clostridia bacterium]
MAVTVADVMREVRNCFPRHSRSGSWTIAGGVLSPDTLMLMEGDWVLVSGSRRSDGIRRVGPGRVIEGAADEAFSGEVTLLRPPAEFLELCAGIAEWDERNSRDAVIAERYGDFSRRRAAGRDGLPADWPTVFRARLMPYRRMFGRETF